LPIISVRVYPHWKRGWYARFISTPGYPNDLKPRFAAAVAALRESYDLKKDVSART
jgi:hypothetical protein